MELDIILGKPREGKDGLPEIFSLLSLDDEIINKSSSTFLETKSYNWLLRSTGHKQGFKSLSRDKVTWIAKKLLTKRFSTNVDFILDNQNSSFLNFETNKNLLVFIGYFQNHEYLKANSDIFRELIDRADKKSEELDNYRALAERLRPLIVHYRRGDYVGESFGLLSTEYYERAIKCAHERVKFGEIWVFSDDPNQSRMAIVASEGVPIRHFANLNLSPSETLQIMRLGKAYVIANSSFSYWAAMLRHDQAAPVFAPSPWFEAASSPSNIIPEDWSRCNAVWESKLK